jgi:hypothetical protein
LRQLLPLLWFSNFVMLLLHLRLLLPPLPVHPLLLLLVLPRSELLHRLQLGLVLRQRLYQLQLLLLQLLQRHLLRLYYLLPLLLHLLEFFLLRALLLFL